MIDKSLLEPIIQIRESDQYLELEELKQELSDLLQETGLDNGNAYEISI